MNLSAKVADNKRKDNMETIFNSSMTRDELQEILWEDWSIDTPITEEMVNNLAKMMNDAVAAAFNDWVEILEEQI